MYEFIATIYQDINDEQWYYSLLQSFDDETDPEVISFGFCATRGEAVHAVANIMKSVDLEG